MGDQRGCVWVIRLSDNLVDWEVGKPCCGV
jgi:hypothetical protein